MGVSDHRPLRMRFSMYNRSSAARRIQRAYRARRKPAVRSLNRRIKRISLNQCETKMSSQRFWAGTNANPLYHNTTEFDMINLLKTSRGVDDPDGTTLDGRNRVGNEIIARGILFKFMFITAQSRPNLNVMVYIYEYDSNYTAGPPQFWVGPSGGGLAQNRFLDRPNKNQVRVLRKLYIHNLPNYSTVNEAGTERNNMVLKTLWLPLKNRKVHYDGPGTGTTNQTIPRNKDIACAMVAFDTTNTLGSDIVGYVTAQTTLYFKDP